MSELITHHMDCPFRSKKKKRKKSLLIQLQERKKKKKNSRLRTEIGGKASSQVLCVLVS